MKIVFALDVLGHSDKYNTRGLKLLRSGELNPRTSKQQACPAINL